MRKVPVEQAVGQALCHDMTRLSPDGVRSVGFRRGHVVEQADVAVLLDMGKAHVFVWEPDADEVHEEDAATQLAEVIFGQGIAYEGMSEGKIQLAAAHDGLFRVNGVALRAINSVPDYTVACRRRDIAVKAGEGLAGLRIVPLVTQRANVDAAVQIAREAAEAGNPVFEVLPFLPLKTGVIITGSEVYHGRIPDKFEPIMRRKLEQFGADVIGVEKCDDDLEMMAELIGRFRAQGVQLLLLTGGMSVDPDDLTPTAIRATGAEVVCQGVPMQPGNMMVLAYLDDEGDTEGVQCSTALMGVAAASMKCETTSVDVFLPKIFAGVRISVADIAERGENGFCLRCELCHFPTCYFGS